MSSDARSAAIARYAFLHEPEGRRRRGARILAALEDFAGVDVASATILDVGCSAGLMTEALTARGADVVGADVDFASLAHAVGSGGNARYVVARGEQLPFPDESFDAVVCNHVYEHVNDPAAVVREAHRVLRDGGACYFAAGHTLQLVEPHHHLPFLSWLPRGIASAWLRALGRDSRYEERFVAPWRLRELLAPFAELTLVSAQMLRRPSRYGFTEIERLPRPMRQALALAAPLVARLAPTWIFLLRKRAVPKP